MRGCSGAFDRDNPQLDDDTVKARYKATRVRTTPGE